MIRVIIFSLLTYFFSAQDNQLTHKSEKFNIELLYPGDYKLGELDLQLLNGEWWGLFVINNSSYVKKVELKIDTLEPDIQYDWQYRVSVLDSENCIFLFKGLDLSEREIIQFTENQIIRNDEILTFEFGPHHTFFNTKLKSVESIGDVMKRDYSIFLNYNSNNNIYSQELFVFQCYEEELFINLIWAGDLDNDGKTDFIMQIPSENNNEIGFNSGLFLSSYAGTEEMIKMVASFVSSGC